MTTITGTNIFLYTVFISFELFKLFNWDMTIFEISLLYFSFMPNVSKEMNNPIEYKYELNANTANDFLVNFMNILSIL